MNKYIHTYLYCGITRRIDKPTLV